MSSGWAAMAMATRLPMWSTIVNFGPAALSRAAPNLADGRSAGQATNGQRQPTAEPRLSRRSARRKLAQISWMRGVGRRKALVCRPTVQKVSTTILTSSLGPWQSRGPGASERAAAVAPATPSPTFPAPAAVPARVAWSAAAPVSVRRPQRQMHVEHQDAGERLQHGPRRQSRRGGFQPFAQRHTQPRKATLTRCARHVLSASIVFASTLFPRRLL